MVNNSELEVPIHKALKQVGPHSVAELVKKHGTSNTRVVDSIPTVITYTRNVRTQCTESCFGF